MQGTKDNEGQLLPEEAMGKHTRIAKDGRVAWRSRGATAGGTVKRKLTRRGQAAGRTVDASPDDPQYLVRSEKSGGTAVHKPQAPTRKPKRGD